MSEQDSLGVQLMQLTMAPEIQAVAQAKALLAQAKTVPAESAIMDLVATIMLYKLSTLSREEIEAMLGLDRLESRALREEAEKGEARGRQEEGRSLILRQLNRRVGPVPDRCITQIQSLSLAQLESLGEALLDFTVLADLEAWLQGDDLRSVGDHRTA